MVRMQPDQQDGLKMKPDETTYYRPDTAQDNLQRRLAILGIFIVAAFCVLFARLWFMQIVAGNDYRKKAEGNRIREISLEAPRGTILDRNGKVLVKNRSALTISVVPAELQDDEQGHREALEAARHGREGDSLQDREVAGSQPAGGPDKERRRARTS